MAFAILYDKLCWKTPNAISNATYNELSHRLTSTSTTNTALSSNYFKILVAGISGGFSEIFNTDINGSFSYTYTLPQSVARIRFAFNGNVVDRYATFSVSNLGLTAGTLYIIYGVIQGLGLTANSGTVYKLVITPASAPIHDFDTLYYAMSTVSEACDVGQITLTTTGNLITSPSGLAGLYTNQCILKDKCFSAGCDVLESTSDHDLTYANNQMVRFYDLAKRSTTVYNFYANVSTNQLNNVFAESNDGRGTTVLQTLVYSNYDTGLNSTYIRVDTGFTYDLNISFNVPSNKDYTIKLTPMLGYIDPQTGESHWSPTMPIISETVSSMPKQGGGYAIAYIFYDLQNDYLITFE